MATKRTMRILWQVLAAVYICCAVLLQSCTTDSVDNVKVTGTVVFVALEGGFYGIKGDDGKNYDPTNLSKEFQINGLRVRCELKELQGTGSIHMWGTIVEIVSIQKL